MKLRELEHKLLQALPADAYELRDAVTKLFERLTLQSYSATMDELLFATCTMGPRYIVDRAERLHEEALGGSLRCWVTHEWANHYTNGDFPHRTLRSSIVFLKPLGDPVAGADHARDAK